MSVYSIIKLNNLSPLHIGTGKENYDFSAANLHSDTISSALASVWVTQHDDAGVEDFLNSFTVSSAFPFWKDYYFLPRLIGNLNIKVAGKEEQEYRKLLKKVKYIESGIWQKMISGDSVTVKLSQIHGEFIIPESCTDFSCVFKSQVDQRVSVPRADGEDAEPFYFDWIFFDKDAGLYCLVDSDTETMNGIVSLFEILSENGVGTDRTIGGGHFEVSSGNIDITSPENADAEAMLSLFLPASEELTSLDLDQSRYRLVLRGGYISGSSIDRFKHLHKKSVYMFDVGSVFSGTHDLSGKVVNLRPEWNDSEMHDVFRSGKPFYLRIKK